MSRARGPAGALPVLAVAISCILAIQPVESKEKKTMKPTSNPAKDGAVSEAMQSIGQEELERALESAFELLHDQRPPLGPSIAEEIQQAKQTLEQRSLDGASDVQP